MSERRDLSVICMTVTPFREDGSVDEQALRLHLRRLVAARNDIYLPGPGAGEAHSLSVAELRRIYEIGVEEAKGKVGIYAALREGRTAADVWAVAREAVAAGVDAVQIYQLDGGHGMIPTEREQDAYWTELLDEVGIPVAISIDYHSRFRAPTSLVVDLCRRYAQVHALNVVGASEAYFLELRDALPPRVELTHGVVDLMQFASLGATAFHGPQANVVPHLVRRLADDYLAGDLVSVAKGTAALQRFLRFVDQWAPSTARWVKMAMKVQGLGNGVLHRPYLLPPEEEQQRMKAGLDAMRIAELEAAAASGRAALWATERPGQGMTTPEVGSRAVT